LQHCSSKSPSDIRSELLSRLFHASLAVIDYETAYSALARYTNPALQKSAVTSLVTSMAGNGYIEELLSLPFTTLKKEIQEVLSEKAQSEIDLPISATPTIPYFKILYAFHLRHKDYRSAASVLVSRLESRYERRVKGAANSRFLSSKLEAEKSLDEYLVGINALALLDAQDGQDDDEAWVFVEDGLGDREVKKRRVMQLKGLRERYQAEIDRVGAIEMGKWGVVDDDEMEGVET
jgi:nuclear pore complex protein Nup160